MSLVAVPAGMSASYLTILARTKAAQVSNKPELDLRLLLAHVKILDQLEHNFTPQAVVRRGAAAKHGSERERKRSSSPSSTITPSDNEFELDALFDYASKPLVSGPPSLVSVEEVELEDADA